MNQSLASFVPPQLATSPEVPGLLQVVRRFAWLLAAGTLLGLLLACGLYLYVRAHHPRFRARVQFQVLTPQLPLGAGENTAPVLFNSDDTAQFIHRQVLRIKQERLLNRILQSREFQSDRDAPEEPGRRSRWLAENRGNPVAALARDLRVTPLIESGAFEISMTAPDPYEAWAMVNAAERIYLEDLRADEREAAARRIEALGRVREDQERTVRSLGEGLQAYQVAQQVPALAARYELELRGLAELEARIVELEGRASAAKLRVERFGKEGKIAGEAGEAAGGAEVERFIEEDAGMRGLRSQKLAIEQEKAGAVASPLENRLFEARAAKIDRQIEKARAELRGRGLADLRARAGDELAELEAQLAFMRSAGDQKRRGVETLDGALVEYRRKVEELKDQEAVLEKLRRQDVLLTLNSNTDAGRVQRIGGTGGAGGAGGGGIAGGEGELVSPSLPVYLAAGGLGGLGASLLGAYLLLVTDHRIRTPRDITAGLGQPLLGFVPDARDDPARRLRNRAAGAGAALGAGGGLLEEGDAADGERVSDGGDAEGDGEGGGKRGGMMRDSFRRIRAQYAAQTAHTPVGTLLVASLSAGGGATSVAWSLAAGMARRERRVLLVDANFYRPALHHPRAPGFGDLLRDPELMESAIVPSQRIGRLHLLGAGRCCPELLEGNALAVLLERLRARYDLIVFDGAPLDLVADSFTLAARVEGVIGVIRAGKVSRGAALRIREQLRLAHAHFLGFVLNAARTTSGGYFKETYRGFYRYASERGKAAR